MATISELVAAARLPSTSRLERLLASTPSVNDLCPKSGFTALHAACYDARVEAVELLLARGADPNALAHDIRPIYRALAASFSITQRHVDDRVRIARMLIEAGDSLASCLGGGVSVLMHASSLGKGKARAFVRELIERGADATGVAHDGDTLLHVAARCDQPDALEAALSRGVDVNAVNRRKETALHVAAHEENESIILRLIAAGADPERLDARGKTPRSLVPKALQSLFDGKAVARRAPRPAPAPRPIARTEAELLAAIWKTPGDAHVLSIYADWLSSRGDAARGEYIQLALLSTPTAAQEKRAAQLLKANRGKWLGDARPVVHEWVDSVETPGFVSTVAVTPEKLRSGFHLLPKLGPRLVLAMTPIKNRAVAMELSQCPLGSLYGLELYNKWTDWVDDRRVMALAPGMRGLRSLLIRPKRRDPALFSPAAIDAVADHAGPTLESLTLIGLGSRAGFLKSVLSGRFPALRRLVVERVHDAGELEELRARKDLEVTVVRERTRTWTLEPVTHAHSVSRSAARVSQRRPSGL